MDSHTATMLYYVFKKIFFFSTESFHSQCDTINWSGTYFYPINYKFIQGDIYILGDIVWFFREDAFENILNSPTYFLGVPQWYKRKLPTILTVGYKICK